MGDYEAGTATFISVIIGIFMFIFFDGVFVSVFTGFLATYLTKEENRSPIIGAIASLILILLFSVYGMISGPEIPSYIISMLGFDSSSFILGFTFMCFLSCCLGFLGGFIASKVSRERIKSTSG